MSLMFVDNNFPRIFSFLMGLLTGIYLYRNLITVENFHGPDSNDITKHIYQKAFKYYQFTPEICPCPL